MSPAAAAAPGDWPASDGAPPDLEFFWDPVCPWAWITSRWVHNVAALRPLEVDWRFIALRFVNEERDYEREFRPGHENVHNTGLRLLRVAAATRARLGRRPVGDLYTAFGTRLHVEGDRDAFAEPDAIAMVLAELGLPVDLAEAADRPDHDEAIRSDTTESLERCGGNVGTPILSFAPPEGPSFFGPVISQAPEGQEALDLWDAVTRLGSSPWFSELKRSTRGRPRFG
ncbi:MAG: mycothiol-dependent nitroreductase Rv2466c family protein [Acidimicrobiales bacterium]